MTKKQKGGLPTVQTTASSKKNKDHQGRQQPTVLYTPHIPLSPPRWKPPTTNTGRLIQPHNLFKVFTANVQSLSPKMDELIALIQVKKIDVIGLNETWLDTQNKHLLAEIAIHGYKLFPVDKPTPTGREGGSIMYVKNTLNPIEIKSSATYTREFIQVDINPKNAVHLKLALIYRNTRIAAADEDEFYTIL